jgi:hypothetical protein
LPSYPTTVNDTVLYNLKNIYADKNVVLTLLDGSTLELWGAVYINGSLIGEGGGSYPIATQPEAEAGTDNTKVMTSLRVAQAIDAQLPLASQAEAQAGVENTKYMSALRVKEAILTLAPGATVISVNTKTGAVVLNQDEILDGTTFKQYSATEKTKLSGIAAGATANSSDAVLLARANHTGSQAISTISGLQAALDAKANDSAVVHNLGNETIAGVKTFSSDPLIPDEVYGIAWDGSLEPPTKNAVYDKIQTLGGGLSDGDKGEITVASGGTVWTIDNSVVTNAKMANMANGTFKANASGSSGAPQDVTGASATAMLDTFITTNKGLVPPPMSLASKYLKDDGTWDIPSGGGGLTQEQVEDYVAAMFAAGTQTDCTVSYNDTSGSLSITVTGVPALSVATGDIIDDAVTLAKMQEIAANSFLANNTGSTANPQVVSQSSARTLLAINLVDNTSDASKPVSTAQQTALNLKRNIAQTLNAQTGTTYTLVLTDADKLVTLSNAAAITLTVPTNASVAFPVGTNIDLVQLGAGQVTVSGTPTLRYTPTAKFRAQYSGASLVKLATDEWLLVGDLASS